MVNITKEGLISICRGDTFNVPLYLNLGTLMEPDYYDMQEGDFVYFALLEANQKWEEAIVKKIFKFEDFDINTSSLTITFKSSDTENLLPGNYYYQIKLYRDANNTVNNMEDVITIVDRTKFVIHN